MRSIHFISLAIFSLWFSISAGAEWTVVGQPFGTVNIRDLDVSSPTDIWVCGDEGLIGQFNGTEWLQMTSNVTQSLGAIEMVDDQNGWACGSFGTLVQCTAGVWTPLSGYSEEIEFKDLAVIDTNDVYFIAYGFMEGTTVFHWNGTEIVEAYKTGGNGRSMAAENASNIWISGTDSKRIYYDGASWQEDTLALPTPCHLHGVTIDEDGNPIVSGNLTGQWDHGRIFTKQNGTWNTLFAGVTGENALLLDVEVLETVGFAVGGGGVLIENSIYGWQKANRPISDQINRLDFYDMSQAWAVGNKGYILHYAKPAIDVQISQKMFHAGDLFSSQYQMLNPGEEFTADVFILLEVFGSFYFAPSWGTTPDSTTVTIPANSNETFTIFPEFTWPEVGSGADGIKIWGAFLIGGELIGYDTESFGWE